jgi:AcrR family transcriptional regulator
MSKRDLNKEKRIEDIFEAALQCFNESGYDATSMESIALKSKISKGGMYHYFNSKKDLFLSLFDYRVNKYFEETKEFLNPKDDPEKRIRTLVKQAGKILKKNEDFYRFCLEFLAKGVRDKDIRRVMTGFYKNCVSTFKDLVEEGIENGCFKRVDSDKASRAMYFLIMGVYFTYYSIDPDFEVVEQHSFHIDNILRSIIKE